MITFTRRLERRPDPVRLLETAVAAGDPVFFWAHPAGERWIAARGIAWERVLEGPHAMGDASRLHGECARRLALRGEGPPPVFFSAFRFAQESLVREPWNGIPPAWLCLPEAVVMRQGAASWMSVTASAQDAHRADGIWRERHAWIRTSPDPGSPAPVLLGAAEAGRARWKAAVERILGSIRRGELEKATLARHIRLRFSAPWPVARLVERLGAAYPDCRIFAFAADGWCFAGATPELLAAVRGGELTSVCLAGSAPRGVDRARDDELARCLLDDDKERREHEIVRRWIEERLRPVTVRLAWNATPEVRRLPRVQHLETVFRARLAPGADLLRALAAIHPTPAVGGWPLDRALQIVREEEPSDRGWYAGALGQLDAQGDGEMGLGIRSALLRGRDVHLYAGAGIVAGSDAAREWEEAGWKLAPLLQALRLEDSWSALVATP